MPRDLRTPARLSIPYRRSVLPHTMYISEKPTASFIIYKDLHDGADHCGSSTAIDLYVYAAAVYPYLWIAARIKVILIIGAFKFDYLLLLGFNWQFWLRTRGLHARCQSQLLEPVVILILWYVIISKPVLCFHTAVPAFLNNHGPSRKLLFPNSKSCCHNLPPKYLDFSLLFSN